VEFSRPSGAEAELVERAVNFLTRVDTKKLFSPFSLPDWMPYKGEERHHRRVLDKLVWNAIRTREKEIAAGEPPRTDLLGTLLSWRDADAGADGVLTDQEVRDQCMTLFLGGHDTTAATLTWWGLAMTMNPDAAQQATEEIDRVLGSRLPTYEDIPQLGYLSQTLQETLRLYPPFPLLVTRSASETVQLSSIEIPKGATVMLSPWVVQRDPRWFPDPKRFDPERFSKQNSANRPRGVYMPFGAGPRVCIGNIFGMTQLTLVAAMVLQRFRLKSVMTPNADANPSFYFTLQPANNLKLLIERR
jgi:cytochrome P450